MSGPPIEPSDLDDLLDLVTRANDALLTGDARSYFALVRPDPSSTLMTPFGSFTLGYEESDERTEAIGRFFRGGHGRLELLARHAAGDVAVLVLVERQVAAVGTLPEQDWSLRVTLVFRRETDGWRLLHRHADPLVERIAVERSAALARGEP